MSLKDTIQATALGFALVASTRIAVADDGKISNVTHNGNQISFTLPTDPSHTSYAVQVSPDLTNWITVANQAPGTIYTETVQPNAKRFYRTMAQDSPVAPTPAKGR